MADSYENENHWTRRDFLRTLSLAVAAMPLRPGLSFPQAGTAKFFSRQQAAPVFALPAAMTSCRKAWLDNCVSAFITRVR